MKTILRRKQSYHSDSPWNDALLDEGKTVKEIGKQLGMKPEEVFRLSGFSRDEFLDLMTEGHSEYSRAVVYKKI